MLTARGSLEDVTLVNINFALTAACFRAGVDDRRFRNRTEPARSRRAGGRFFPGAGVPAYDELIFVARNDRLGDPVFPLPGGDRTRGHIHDNHPEEAGVIPKNRPN
jgi:hypothetical protein